MVLTVRWETHPTGFGKKPNLFNKYDGKLKRLECTKYIEDYQRVTIKIGRKKLSLSWQKYNKLLWGDCVTRLIHKY